jgi:hypothetical protein
MSVLSFFQSLFSHYNRKRDPRPRLTSKKKKKTQWTLDHSDAGSRTQSSRRKLSASWSKCLGVHRAPRPTYSFVLVVVLVGDIIQREHEFGAGPNELERTS